MLERDACVRHACTFATTRPGPSAYAARDTRAEIPVRSVGPVRAADRETPVNYHDRGSGILFFILITFSLLYVLFFIFFNPTSFGATAVFGAIKKRVSYGGSGLPRARTALHAFVNDVRRRVSVAATDSLGRRISETRFVHEHG